MANIRNLLAVPFLYRVFQDGVGARRFRSELVARYIKPQRSDRIVDIGCGTADIRFNLGDVDYFGFDPSVDYIETARAKHPGSTFHVGSVDHPPDLSSDFDIALAIGVLHHVEDREAVRLFELARSLLRPGGKLVTADPVRIVGTNRLSNLIVGRDRGDHVRTGAEYLSLAEDAFPESVEGETRTDLLRIPYQHFVMTCAGY